MALFDGSFFRDAADFLGPAVGGASRGFGSTLQGLVRPSGPAYRPPAQVAPISFQQPQGGGSQLSYSFGQNQGIANLFSQRFGTGAAGLFAPPGVAQQPYGLGTSALGGGNTGLGLSPENDKRIAASAAKPATGTGTGAGTGGVGATGADAATDKWRDLIDQAAAANGIDGDVIQAIMMIESQGNQNARSGAGAMGLMQVMPFHFGAGEDGMDPKTNVFKGAKILADNYNRYKNWDSAVAAYLGAVDANGNPTTTTDMYGTSGIHYAEMFNKNLQAIKAKRQSQPAQGGGGGSGMSSIWGGGQGNITQQYGVVTPGIDQGIYGYGAAYGLPQGHTGDDIGLRRGTQLFMPAGLTGVVETAGGTPYFRDEDYGDNGTPGKGELRIRLSNGDILILGHTSQIGVGVGQTVTAGQALGLSGSANGDHLHLEVRVRQPDGSYRLIDPGKYFGG